jgi:pimeloyl-ACP methyl ester carboxylesterase
MQLSMGSTRQWLIHGSVDQDVPPSFSRDYVRLRQKRTRKETEDVHLVEIPGAGHLDLIDPRSRAWSMVEKSVLEAVA